MLTSLQIKKLQGNAHRDKPHFVAIFRALGDQTRFRMLVLLHQQKELCVTDFAKILKISLPAASHQLKILENAGLVVGERMGQTMCYEIKNNSSFIRILTQLIT